MRNIAQTLLAIMLLLPAVSFSAGEELLWWVTNDSVSDIVPLYEGQANPFPIIPKPVEVKVKKEEVKVVAPPKKNLAGATLLAKIRKYLQSGGFVSPDIYTLKIKGYLEGEHGPKVLINDIWHGVGDKVTVPMQRLEEFNDLLDELEAVDEVLFDTVTTEISKKIAKFNNFTLKITKIDPENIKLVDQNGEHYVISYITGGL